MIYVLENPLEISEEIKLPKWREEKAFSYKKAEDRKLSALSYALLMYALNKEYGIVDFVDFSYGSNGKPYLKGYENIKFNISHCANAIAVIVSSKEVGIDVCSKNRVSEKVKEKISAENEKHIDATTLFSKKEAAIKLQSSSIAVNLKNVDVSHIYSRTREKYVLSASENADNINFVNIKEVLYGNN